MLQSMGSQNVGHTLVTEQHNNTVENDSISLFFRLMYKYNIYIDYMFFIHSSVDGHVCCLHVLAIVNNAAMHIRVHVSFWIRVLSGYMPRNGIPESYATLFSSF